MYLGNILLTKYIRWKLLLLFKEVCRKSKDRYIVTFWNLFNHYLGWLTYNNLLEFIMFLME